MLALGLVKPINIEHATAKRIIGLYAVRSVALLLAAINKSLGVTSRILVVINAMGF